MYDIFRLDFRIETEEVQKCRESLQTEELEAAARVFEDNTEGLLTFLLAPHLCVHAVLPLKFGKSDEILLKLLEDETARRSFRYLVYAFVVNTWTAFECLAKDLWIAALNARPRQLAQPAFKHIGEGDESGSGLSSRCIPVGLAARHDFVLSSCLGTILSKRFDFTSVSGIRVAYRAAFEPAERLQEILGSRELAFLEGARHLVVHRAGVVDDEFNRRTGLEKTVGEPIEFEKDEIQRLANTTVVAGTKLLELVDQAIAPAETGQPN